MLLDNNDIIRKYKLREYLFIFFVVFTVISILIEIRNDRFWLPDFEVYYKSAQRAWDGENLFQLIEDNDYCFKYSPFSAYLFIPFLLFSFGKAKIIYTFFLSFLMCINYLICFSFCLRSLNFKFKNTNITYIIIFLFSFFPIGAFFARELHLGQVNIILLFLYLSSFYFFKSKPILSMTLLSMSGLIKPYFLIFLVYFIYEKKFKYIFYAITSFFSLSLIPLLTYKGDILLEQYDLWINELKIELYNENNFLYSENVSVFSMFKNYVSLEIFQSSYVIYVFVLFILACFVIYFMKKTSINLSEEAKLFYDFSLLCSLIALLTSNGRSVFIMILPIIFIVIMNLKLRNYVNIIIFIVSIIFIGCDVSDGGIYTSWIRKFYFVPIGVFLLIALLLTSINKQKNIVTLVSRQVIK